MPPCLRTIDMFGQLYPGFNLQGQQKVRTSCGGFTSLVVLYTVFMFALLKLIHLITHHQPDINMYKLTDVYDESYIFEPGDENFMVAFALEDYFTYEFKNNSDYIKWAAMFETIEDERHVKQEIPMRFCTDEDYDKFYPVKESNANKLKLIREDPNRGMLCLDWENSGVQF